MAQPSFSSTIITSSSSRCATMKVPFKERNNVKKPADLYDVVLRYDLGGASIADTENNAKLLRKKLTTIINRHAVDDTGKILSRWRKQPVTLRSNMVRHLIGGASWLEKFEGDWAPEWLLARQVDMRYSEGQRKILRNKEKSHKLAAALFSYSDSSLSTGVELTTTPARSNTAVERSASEETEHVAVSEEKDEFSARQAAATSSKAEKKSKSSSCVTLSGTSSAKTSISTPTAETTSLEGDCPKVDLVVDKSATEEDSDKFDDAVGTERLKALAEEIELADRRRAELKIQLEDCSKKREKNLLSKFDGSREATCGEKQVCRRCRVEKFTNEFESLKNRNRLMKTCQHCQRSLTSPLPIIEGARQRKESKRKAANQAVDDEIAEIGAAKRAKQRANRTQRNSVEGARRQLDGESD